MSISKEQRAGVKEEQVLEGVNVRKVRKVQAGERDAILIPVLLIVSLLQDISPSELICI